MTLIQIDKAGDDILTKNYSISIVLNKEKVYGFKLNQFIQDRLLYEFKTGSLKIKSRLRFKLRFHTSVIILILKAIFKENANLGDIKIEICNDHDKHFHEIKDMIFRNLNRNMPDLKRENIVLQKFHKESLVNQSAHDIFKNNKERIKNYNFYNLKLENLRRLIIKSGNQGQ